MRVTVAGGVSDETTDEAGGGRVVAGTELGVETTEPEGNIGILDEVGVEEMEKMVDDDLRL
jgi:hypothetical protein